MSLITLCMGEKPDETATAAATQTLELAPSSQETLIDDNDDDVLIVSY